MCGINFHSSNFQALFSLLAGRITGISLKGLHSIKKIFKITGPTLSRINSVIVSARTVGILVSVRFGARLCVSLAAPKVSKRMGIKMASFLSFETLTFWYHMTRLDASHLPERLPRTGENNDNASKEGGV